MDFTQVRSKSLTETFIEYVEKLILSGNLAVGEQLPPERELAKRTGVSRPVVHESLVKLEGKGLVTIIPRHGVYINDFRSTGSLDLLLSLTCNEEQEPDPKLLESLFEIRSLFEERIAYLAARNATIDDLSALEEVLQNEQKQIHRQSGEHAEAEVQFLHRLALASGNLVYPFMVNSLRPLYMMFFTRLYGNPVYARDLFASHRHIVDAIMAHDAQQAAAYMQKLLSRSREALTEHTGSTP